jgi:hypothetical protein
MIRHCKNGSMIIHPSDAINPDNMFPKRWFQPAPNPGSSAMNRGILKEQKGVTLVFEKTAL